MKTKRDMIPILLSLMLVFLLFSSSNALAVTPQIASIANDSAAVGSIYSKVPSLVAGSNVRWTKEFGPDDMTVDPVTGAVSWGIPSGLAREAFHLGVRATNADGSVYTTWILKVGGGNYIYCGTGEVATNDTIAECTALASSGDTIVVRDGTYSGASNAISNITAPLSRGNLPPSGTSSAYTTIMAEHPGQVTLDGSSARTMIGIAGNYSARDVGTQSYTYDARYISIKGFVALGSSGSDPHISEIHVMHGQYIKLIDCGASGSIGQSAPITIYYSNFVTTDGCYVWGLGRMGIVYYKSDYNIIRRSVARIDRSTMANPFGGGFDLYACQHSRVQNSIVVDMDQKAYYTNYTNIEGVFIDSSGSSRTVQHLDNVFRKSIALNIDNVITISQDNTGDIPTFDNIVAWDIRTLPNSSATPTYANSFIGGSDDFSMNQCTIGNLASPTAPIQTHDPMPTGGTAMSFNGWSGTQTITNSIINNVLDFGGTPAALFYSFETVNYNNIYGTGAINSYNTTPTNTITSNPTTTCLKYLPRIESACTITGISGARVGANIMYMTGKSGTLFGESGYDTEETTPMWPFPHEDLIKSKMQAYSYDGGKLTGNRGFASSTAKQLNGSSNVTLTSYIWEYLGNQMPSNIYGTIASVPSVPSTPKNVTVVPPAAK